MTQLLVRYVGLKASRNDNVAGTGLTWFGQDDVHPVPAAAWDKLKRHPDVWELVPSGDAPVLPVAGTLGAAKSGDPKLDTDADEAKAKADAEAAEAAEAARVAAEAEAKAKAEADKALPDFMATEDLAVLRQIAKAKGVTLHHKTKDVAKIREAIAAAAKKVEA